jgi:hypothetical protein
MIGYEEYVAEQINKSISYSNYLAEQIYRNISYTEYLSAVYDDKNIKRKEKIKRLFS